MVRQHWQVVEEYRDVYQFNVLNELNVKKLMDHLESIVFEVEEDELSKRFHQFCYMMELEVLKHGSVAVHLVQETRSLADALSKRTTIPMVGEKIPSSKKCRGAAY